MWNESNKDVKIIDENYTRVFKDNLDEVELFDDINVDSLSKTPKLLKDKILDFFEQIKNKIFGNNKEKKHNIDFQTKDIMENNSTDNNSQNNRGNNAQKQYIKSLVNKKEDTSIKEVDENYKNNNNDYKEKEDSQEDMNFDEENQLESNNDNQQQNGEDTTKKDSLKKGFESLVDKKYTNESGDQSTEGGNETLEENTTVTATFSNSDELTKLNVEWTSNDIPEGEKVEEECDDSKTIEEKLLEAFFKYLVKKDFYVKTYGLDKKNRKQIAKHFLLDLEHKILTDTYSDQTKPLAFYIDMKGECSQLREYSDFFNKLFNKKDIIIHIGNRGNVVKSIKVKKAGANLDFDRCDLCRYFGNDCLLPSGENYSEYFDINVYNESLPLEEFVRRNRVFRLVTFADFEASTSIIRASLIVKMYWFCTELRTGDIYDNGYSLKDFKGEFIIASEIYRVLEYFKHINDPSYEIKQRKLQLEL